MAAERNEPDRSTLTTDQSSAPTSAGHNTVPGGPGHDSVPVAAGHDTAEEPLTIAQAARRVGVHPNTVRRLIHQGVLPGLLIKGRHGDTWLVDAAELRRIVRSSRRAGRSATRPRRSRDQGAARETPPHAGGEGGGEGSGDLVDSRSPHPNPLPKGEGTRGPHPGPLPGGEGAGPTVFGASRPDVDGEAEEVARVQDAGGGGASSAATRWLMSTVDLSLDRAQALERYTHSLLAPLVDLLREREAAMERREIVMRHQAERIGRLEREVELLRAQVAGMAPSSVSAGAGERPAAVTGTVRPSPAGPERAPDSDTASATASDEAAKLAAQVQHLREDLSQMAQITAQLTAAQAAAQAASQSDHSSTAEEAGVAQAPAPQVPRAPAPETAAPSPFAAQSSDLGPQSSLDPFADAETAIRELQRALMAQTAGAPAYEQTAPELAAPPAPAGTSAPRAAPPEQPLGAGERSAGSGAEPAAVEAQGASEPTIPSWLSSGQTPATDAQPAASPVPAAAPSRAAMSPGAASPAAGSPEAGSPVLPGSTALQAAQAEQSPPPPLLPTPPAPQPRRPWWRFW